MFKQQALYMLNDRISPAVTAPFLYPSYSPYRRESSLIPCKSSQLSSQDLSLGPKSCDLFEPHFLLIASVPTVPTHCSSSCNVLFCLQGWVQRLARCLPAFTDSGGVVPALWPPRPRIPSWGCQGGQQSLPDTVRGPAFRYQTLSAGQATKSMRETDQDTGCSRCQASMPRRAH